MKKENDSLPPQPDESAPRTYSAPSEASPDALVIYCSSPRFQAAFQEFIEDTLGLAKGQYIPFVVAGGPGALARPFTLPKEFKFMKDRLELLTTQFKSVKRIIFINHEDCAYYKNLPVQVVGNLLSKLHIHLARKDLELITQVFTRTFSHLGVQLELYYARFANPEHTQVVFDRIG